MDEVERIARGLSKAQRACVLAMSKTGGGRIDSLIPQDMPRELVEPVPHGGRELIYRLSSTGRAVRLYLVRNHLGDTNG